MKIAYVTFTLFYLFGCTSPNLIHHRERIHEQENLIVAQNNKQKEMEEKYEQLRCKQRGTMVILTTAATKLETKKELIQQLEGMLEKSVSKIDFLEHDLNKAREEKKALEEIIRSEKEKISHYEEDIRLLREELHQIKYQYQLDVEKLSTKLGELQEENTLLLALVDDLKNYLKHAEAYIKSLEEHHRKCHPDCELSI